LIKNLGGWRPYYEDDNVTTVTEDKDE